MNARSKSASRFWRFWLNGMLATAPLLVHSAVAYAPSEGGLAKTRESNGPSRMAMLIKPTSIKELVGSYNA